MYGNFINAFSRPGIWILYYCCMIL